MHPDLLSGLSAAVSWLRPGRKNGTDVLPIQANKTILIDLIVCGWVIIKALYVNLWVVSFRFTSPGLVLELLKEKLPQSFIVTEYLFNC